MKRILPLQVFIIYLAVIAICGILYSVVPGIFKSSVGLLDGFYFSVVTITTLGYGDLTPISGFGKMLAAFEALLGVVLIGLFLLSVGNEIADRQENKRKASGKINLKAQYQLWREDVVMSLLFLATPGHSVSYDLAKSLYSPEKFKNHFSENKNERWYAVANNLSSENYYTSRILSGLEMLQHHIQTFITITPITDEKVLQRLTGYINLIARMRSISVDDYDDQKSFCRDLWSIVALWDASTGKYGHDYLIEAIDNA